LDTVPPKNRKAKPIFTGERRMKHIIKTISRATRRTLTGFTQRYAPYEVRCTYGTRQRVWTLREAMSWFPLCEGLTIIVRRGELVASRDPQSSQA
jgi:hypothetical protein